LLGALIESYRTAFRGLSREVWILSIVLLINRSGTMVLPFLTLYLTTQRGYEPAQAGLVVALYGVGAMAGTMLGGRATDVVGFKAVQVGSLIATGLCMFVLGAVRSEAAIAVTVTGLGLAAESFRPANSTALAAFAAPAARTRAFGLQRLAVNIGWTIGPALGGFLALYDYQVLFWVDGSTCLAAAIPLALLLPERKQPAVREKRSKARGGSPWRDGPYVVALALTLVQGLVFFQLLSTFPLFLRQERGFTEDMVGLTIATNTIVIILAEMQLIRALERVDPLKLIGLAGLLMGIGFGLLPVAVTVLAIVGTVVVWTFGETLSFPIATAWAANRANDEHRGRYMGSQALVFSFATVAAPLGGTAAYERFGPTPLWLGCLVLGALSFAGFLLLARHVRAQAAPPNNPAK